MRRLLYRALLWLALPVALLRLAWRSRRQPGYRHRLAERFGAAPCLTGKAVVWIHAVSLGETRAAVPLVAWVRETLPGATVLLTHGTPTGREAGRALFGDAVRQCWLPWDLPFAVRRFLSRAQPSLGLVLETEVWPTLQEEAKRAAVPVYLVNARLSARSARRYAWGGAFLREAFSRFSGVAAQALDDAERLRSLGAHPVTTTGNLKFDLVLPPDLEDRARAMRRWYGEGRPVWVIGSTREGEEALLIDAIGQSGLPPEVLVVLVPRHPQRFDEVAALLGTAGRPVARRSSGGTVPPGERFALGDSMGEMLAYYAAGDIVLVGGSLLPYGGQNLIEPCAVGRPVLVGPHTYNFSAAADEALRLGAALRCADAHAAVAAAAALFGDTGRRERMARAAAGFASANRGAMSRLAAWLAPAISAMRDRGPG